MKSIVVIKKVDGFGGMSMTRDEAIKILERRTTIPGDGYSFEQINEAIDIAISIISSTTKKQLKNLCNGDAEMISNLENAFNEMFDFITDLPSGLDGFESDFDSAFKELNKMKDIQNNENLLNRVIKDYLEICDNNCMGDPSVGIPECPFYKYADVLDNGALVEPRCELSSYLESTQQDETR